MLSIGRFFKTPVFGELCRYCPVLYRIVSFLQNPVGFAEALAVFRPRAYKTAFFSLSLKNVVLQGFSGR
jgi:hypothetical protein